MSKVYTSGLHAGCFYEIWHQFSPNSKKRAPVNIMLVGTKADLKAILARTKLPKYIGQDPDDAAFTIEGPPRDHPEGFNLPDKFYRTMMSKVGNSGLMEGRIISTRLNQTTDGDDIYVLVNEPIDIKIELQTYQAGYEEAVNALVDDWMLYYNIRTGRKVAPADYKPAAAYPALYKLFLTIEPRLTLPIHPSYIPIVFRILKDRERRDSEFVTGYAIRSLDVLIDPMLRSHIGADSALETGGYYLNFGSFMGCWEQAVIAAAKITQQHIQFPEAG